MGQHGAAYHIGCPIICRLQNPATLVNKTGDTGIGRPANIFARLDSPKGGKKEMLAVPGGITPPSIVGDHKQQLCAVAGEPTKESAIGRLIANGRTNRWPALPGCMTSGQDRCQCCLLYLQDRWQFIHKGEVFYEKASSTPGYPEQICGRMKPGPVFNI
jgi:hypothetical protein